MYKFAFTNGRGHDEETNVQLTFSLPIAGARAKGEDPVRLAKDLARMARDKHVQEDFYPDLLRLKVLVNQLCVEFSPKEPVNPKNGGKSD